MKIYALPRVDGGVELMYSECAPNDCLAKWHQSRRAELTGEVREISASDIPQDRTYRNAWKLSEAGVEVDPVKAAQLDAEKAARLL